MDRDVGITQSNAIMRYIGRKHNMLGKTEEERVRVDIMENQSMDFRNGWVRLCYNPSFVSRPPWLGGEGGRGAVADPWMSSCDVEAYGLSGIDAYSKAC